GGLLSAGRIPSRTDRQTAPADVRKDGGLLPQIHRTSQSVRRDRRDCLRARQAICGYFIRAPFPGDKLPVLICMGGLDSIKDEMWFMQAHGSLQRGISVLMIDGPGQGGTLRRHKLATRHDTEVPIGRCIDWLEKRADVDAKR